MTDSVATDEVTENSTSRGFDNKPNHRQSRQTRQHSASNRDNVASWNISRTNSRNELPRSGGDSRSDRHESNNFIDESLTTRIDPLKQSTETMADIMRAPLHDNSLDHYLQVDTEQNLLSAS